MRKKVTDPLYRPSDKRRSCGRQGAHSYFYVIKLPKQANEFSRTQRFQMQTLSQPWFSLLLKKRMMNKSVMFGSSMAITFSREWSMSQSKVNGAIRRGVKCWLVLDTIQ